MIKAVAAAVETAERAPGQTAVQPLYPSVPGAARRDPALYDLLALVDAMRLGRARERGRAEKEISQRLNAHVPA